MGLRDLFKSKEARREANPPSFAPPTGPPQAVAPPPTSTRPAAAPEISRPQRGTAQWAPAGHSIVVDRHTIAGGMVYFGSKAPSLDGHSIEPALIDPGLSVHWDRPDRAGTSMGYWPSYQDITPNARAAYLHWLASGRSDPGAYIGYVFLYFYGLERRVLGDLSLDADDHETTAIADEVRRLRAIYGNNGSFRGYADSFLELLDARIVLNGELTPPAFDADGRYWEVPITVKVGIGRFVANGQPIPAPWALSLLKHHPESYLRTAATRCAAEFDSLFTSKYSAKYGPGMVVKPPATKIKLEYRPASGGIGTELAASIDLPDITSIAGPINKLKEIGSEATDLLDPYSRYLGRKPAGAGTAEAISLLPDDLLASHGGEFLDQLRVWLDGVLSNSNRVAVPLAHLIVRWSPERTERLAKRDAVALAGLLAKLGVGIEPDVRFGSPTPAPNTHVVLFKGSANLRLAPSSAYTAAASLVHLTAVVASADGAISEHEQRHLAHHLEEVLGLDAAERDRLEAHLAWLATGKIGMTGIKKRVDTLPLDQRAAIGGFLIDVAAADGVVNRDEISTLTKMFAHLGLDEADVYRQVHALGSGDRGPVTVRGGEVTTRWNIPVAAPDQQSPVILDPAKVQARLAETASVTALLATIFAEEEPVAAPPPSPWAHPPSQTTTTRVVPVAGLDAQHSSLAHALIERSTWTRSEAESLAAAHGLPLLDGAIDRINEAAIDACGDPLIDGDDPLEMNDYAKQELF